MKKFYSLSGQRLVFILWFCLCACSLLHAEKFHFSFVEFSVLPSVDGSDARIIHQVFREELEKRNISTKRANQPWENGIRIVFAAPTAAQIGSLRRGTSHFLSGNNGPSEGFEIAFQTSGEVPTIWIIANRRRAHLYGMGHFLASISTGKKLQRQIDIEPTLKTPAYPLRGHQLGYRNTANSWDAWSVAQFDQYIRDLVLLGSNAIEDIPFQKTVQSVHMQMPHEQMHAEISKICRKYDVQYWVWTPAPGALSEPEVVQMGLENYRILLDRVPQLDAIFFPGGDPGDNHPQYIFPYLNQLNNLVKNLGRDLDIWISLQGFDSAEVIYFFEELKTHPPDWFTGLVHGPSSPPIEVERNLLPEPYKIRLYGDITHTIRCQYPVDQWDQAFALTLGREPINPEPRRYRAVFKQEMPFTDGFLSYSDGVHDDVNKIIWNKLGWDPDLRPREILEDYARYFFIDVPPGQVADGILALEHNWRGPLRSNGSVEPTLAWWQQLDASNHQMQDQWRWQQLIFRAYYDAYTRRRLIHESAVEQGAIRLLQGANTMSTDTVISAARKYLMRSEHLIRSSHLADTIRSLAGKLFDLIQLQTSVPLYQASGFERGAVLDFMDYPLNNRWWMADQFDAIEEMESEALKLKAVDRIVGWSNPGPNGFYDNISRVGESPHLLSQTDDAIDYAWWENGRSRARLSTQVFQFTPTLFYRLNPKIKYFIRVAGYGEALLRANGKKLQPYAYDKSLEGFKEFSIPPSLISDGRLQITFDRPDERHLNWRQYSKVSDVWILAEEN